MRKITRILPLAIVLLLASCVKDKPESSDCSGSMPNDTVEDIRDGIDDDLQPYRQNSEPKNDARADEAQADEQGDAAKPAPARAQKDQTSSSTETPEPQDQQTTQTSYESEIRQRLEHLDSEATQTRARIDAITARKQEIQRQGVQENPDMQLELVTAFNELIDIKNEQIALAIRLGDKKLEREYHAQLTAIQQEQSKING